MVVVCVNDSGSLTLSDKDQDRRAIERSTFAGDNHGIHVHSMTCRIWKTKQKTEKSGRDKIENEKIAKCFNYIIFTIDIYCIRK